VPAGVPSFRPKLTTASPIGLAPGTLLAPGGGDDPSAVLSPEEPRFRRTPVRTVVDAVVVDGGSHRLNEVSVHLGPICGCASRPG
jgi:hypothetical protein